MDLRSLVIIMLTKGTAQSRRDKHMHTMCLYSCRAVASISCNKPLLLFFLEFPVTLKFSPFIRFDLSGSPVFLNIPYIYMLKVLLTRTQARSPPTFARETAHLPNLPLPVYCWDTISSRGAWTSGTALACSHWMCQ